MFSLRFTPSVEVTWSKDTSSYAWDSIPEEYLSFSYIFCLKGSSTLPPHRPCTIDLIVTSVLCLFQTQVMLFFSVQTTDTHLINTPQACNCQCKQSNWIFPSALIGIPVSVSLPALHSDVQINLGTSPSAPHLAFLRGTDVWSEQTGYLSLMSSLFGVYTHGFGGFQRPPGKKKLFCIKIYIFNKCNFTLVY